MYYGEEIGMLNVPVPKEQRLDPMAFAKFPLFLFYRDSERTPMQWSDEEFCGFSNVKSWLPVGDKSINVSQQEND